MIRFEGDNFVLDQQVVRAALKAYNQPPSAPRSPFSAYLRFLHNKGCDVQMTIFEAPDWADWKLVVEVMEWRAARAVQARAIAQQIESIDASSYQRVSRAVTEAYVATQVGEMIRSLSREGLGDSEVILRSLLHLVSSSLLW